MLGPGAELMANETRVDTTEPGLRTLMNTEPVLIIRLAGTTAVNCVALINDVVRLVGPLPESHCTLEAARKLVPVTVSWNAAPPAVAEAGLSPPGDVIVGAAG